MSDMYMSDTEIATGYRTAKNKAKQAGEPLLRVELT